MTLCDPTLLCDDSDILQLQEYRVFGAMRVGITSVPGEEAMREEESAEEEVIAKVIYVFAGHSRCC